MRIVSLIPSATEMVCALGFTGQLVGRSHECDYPPLVKTLPECTEPKFTPSGSSRQLHERVTDLVRDALSVYRVRTDVLESLQPTHIITQDQCAVCAVSLSDVEQAVCELISTKPQIVSLSSASLSGVMEDIAHVGAALGAEKQAQLLVAAMQQRMENVAHRARTLQKPAVACIEWLDPLMAAGNWMPELISMAGGTSLFGEAGVHSPWLEFSVLAEHDPDIIVVMPCGFTIARTMEEMHLLEEHREWQGLRAVETGNVFVADGNQFFNRPGPRLAESLEIMAEMMHPEAFAFGYEGNGWIKYTTIAHNEERVPT